MKTNKIVLTESITAATDLPKNRFIDFEGNLCDQEFALGVSEADTKAGQQCPVTVYGIVLVETGGMVEKGGRVFSDSQGRAVGTETNLFSGYSLDAASGPGELIRVVLR